jgi:hypothetical protein
MYIDIEDLKAQCKVVENDLNRYQEAINQKLSRGEYDIDNMCGRVNQLERLLTSILNKLKQHDCCNPELQTEQERKAIAIIGGGRGVEIRAKNDDPTRYTVKKRKTYGDIIQQKVAPKPNGKPKQQQVQATTV